MTEITEEKLAEIEARHVVEWKKGYAAKTIDDLVRTIREQRAEIERLKGPKCPVCGNPPSPACEQEGHGEEDEDDFAVCHECSGTGVVPR